MSFYGGLADTASGMLADKGQPMTIRRTGVISTDPIAGTVTEQAPVDYTVNGVLLDYKDFLVASGLVQKGDRNAIIEAGIVVPNKDDSLIADGRTWTIIEVTSVKPAGEAVIYKLQVRA